MKETFEVRSESDGAISLYIYGDIRKEKTRWDEERGSEIVAPKVIREALAEAGNKDVNVYINSGGGQVFAGQAIASLLSRHSGRTIAHIDGLCASIATMIALACDEVYMSNGASWMYHQAWGGLFNLGKADEIVAQAEEYAESLRSLNKSMKIVYKSRMAEGGDWSKVEANFDSGKDTWLTVDEAVETFNIKKNSNKKAEAFAASEYIEVPEALQKNSAQEEVSKNKKDWSSKYMFDF